MACVVCHRSLKNTGPFIRKDGGAYHRECLKCGNCKGNVPISGNLLVREGKILCGQCSSPGLKSGPEKIFCSACGFEAENPKAKVKNNFLLFIF